MSDKRLSEINPEHAEGGMLGDTLSVEIKRESAILKKQGNKQNDGVQSLEDSEGQQVFLSCNETSSCCPSLNSSDLSDNTLHRLEDLGGVLRRIHVRMKREGYDIVDGAIIKIDKDNENTK